MKYLKLRNEIVNLPNIYIIRDFCKDKYPRIYFEMNENHTHSFYFDSEKDCNLAYEKINNFLQNKKSFLEL